MNTTSCRTFLVSDAPADSDSLGGAHASIAASVLGVCLSEPGGRIVGLEGGWGSGKSTVLTLMQEQALGDSDVAFITFDAWAHESDPLRRAFLERLTKRLVDKKWLEADKWEGRLKELSGQRKKSRITRKHQLTSFGRKMATAVACAPLGLALIASKWVDGTLSLVAALLLALAPLLMVLGYKVTRGFRAEGGEKDASDPWSVFVQNQSVDELLETTESVEATSLEFERTFSALMQEALEGTTRRVIVCLDNLDRVAAGPALALWSTMQAFTQLSTLSEPGWARSTWFVVPYDPSALTKLWSQVPQRGEGAPSPKPKDVAESFFTKTFAVRFQVPPILVGDWRRYLEKRLATALPDHCAEEFYDVCRVFSNSRPNQLEAPTPREINRFVNQLGVVHRQRGHDFELRDMACFVSLQANGVDVPNSLRERSEPADSLRPFVSGTIEDSLVSLAFGTDLTTARQHLLREPIEAALKSGEGEALRKLVSLPGFWQVLEGVEGTEWLQDNGRAIALAAHAMAEGGILSSDRPEARRISSHLSQVGRSVQAWGPMSATVSAGVVKILGTMVPAEREKAMAAIGASFRVAVPAEGPDQWVAGAKIIVDATQVLGLSQLPPAFFTFPGTAMDWVVACSEVELAGWSPEQIRSLKPSAEFPEIISLIVEKVTTEESPAALSAARVMSHLKELYPISDIREQVIARISTSADLLPVALAQSLSTLEAFDGPNEPGNGAIIGLLSLGWWHHHLESFWRRKEIDGIAQLVPLIVRHATPLSAPPVVGNSATGFAVLKAFLSDPSTLSAAVAPISRTVSSESGLVQWLSAAAADPQTAPLVRAVLLELSGSGRLAGLIGAGQVVEHWPVLHDALAAEDDALGRLVDLKAVDMVSLLLSSHLRRDRLNCYSMIFSRAAGEVPEELLDRAKELVASIAQEEWGREVRAPGELLEFVFALRKRVPAFSLPVAFRDAAREHGIEVLSKDKDVSALAERWTELQDSLGSAGRTVLRDHLLEDMLLKGSAPSAAFLSTYAKLFEEEPLSGGDDRLVLRLVCPIVDAGRPDALAWVARLAAKFPQWLNLADQAHLSDLLERITSAEGRSTEGVSRDLRVLRELCEAALRESRPEL